jgi:branched-chain amino acid transport system substrate-binding protein
MRIRNRKRSCSAAAVGGVLICGFALAACGSSPSGGASPGGKSPVVIGVSISETGDFSADGANDIHAYDVWAANVNKAGGLLGHKVVMKFINDASSTSQVVTNYQTLISVDHVNLVFGPFSSLLTIPASEVAARYGYAFVEPSGGSEQVFSRGLNNVFEAEPQAGFQDMLTFGDWLMTLPKSQRPTTVAYATEDDPFIGPETAALQSMLKADGMKTVYYKVYPLEVPSYTPIALAVAKSHAQVVVLGTNLPDATAFTQTFIQQHYNPKAIVYASGPDQGSQWVKAVGASNTAGTSVPLGWLPGLATYGNKQFVQTYLKMFGGTAASMSTDSGEAYSVGQVMQQAIDYAHSFNNSAIIAALHKLTFKTVQGNFAFKSNGEPTGHTVLAQWTGGKLQIIYPPELAQAKAVYPKPAWGSGS